MVLIGFKSWSLKHMISRLKWQEASILQMMCLRYSLKVMTRKLNQSCWCFSNMIIYHISTNHIYRTLLSFCWGTGWRLFWCTLLKKARLDAKKYKKIKEKMIGLEPEMVAIVHQLHATMVTPQEREITSWKELEKWLIGWRKRELCD